MKSMNYLELNNMILKDCWTECEFCTILIEISRVKQHRYIIHSKWMDVRCHQIYIYFLAFT